MRYIIELDLDRSKNGWGEHYWVVDTHKQGTDRLLRLLPKAQAETEAKRLNHRPKLAGPYMGQSRRLRPA